LWSAHLLLNWSAKSYSVFPLGANDLELGKQGKNVYAVTDGDPLVWKIPIQDDGSAGEPQALGPSGYSPFDRVELDAKGINSGSEIFRSEIWALSPDGPQRLLAANKMTSLVDNNTRLMMKGDSLCTTNLGIARVMLEEIDRTVACTKGFAVPKWMQIKAMIKKRSRKISTTADSVRSDRWK
jgi:hypothetical protein